MSLSYIFFFVLILIRAVDNISNDEPLRDGKKVVLSGGNFELGFFYPTPTLSKRYVGIWLNKVFVQTVVWVSNKDTPLNDKNGMLNFTTQ